MTTYARSRPARAHKRGHLFFALVPALALFGAALGCGSDPVAPAPAPMEEPPVPTFDYPLDDVLRLNQIQAKGTHNSYHIKPDNEIPDWNYTHAPLDVQLNDQGVRKVELDTHYNDETGVFEVYHVPLLDEQTTCRLFTDCLRVMKTWSDAHPAHHTIFIQIEPKEGFDAMTAPAYFQHFEEQVLSVWPRKRIVTPDDVKGSAASIREAVTTTGWPTLGAGRAKILLFMNEAGPFRDYYTRGGKDLDGRLMFVQSDVGTPAPYDALYILNDPKSADIATVVSAGFIVRTRADSMPQEAIAGNTEGLEAALAGPAQIISTDYPAPVPGVDYVVEIPGGQPSRCNPMTAPPECTSEAVEDPAFLAAPSK